MLVLLSGSVCPVFGEVIYVDADAPGANDGSSWQDAHHHLQDAIAAARPLPGRVDSEIRIAQGVYKPDEGATVRRGDRNASFSLKDGLTIRGGYAGYGEPDPNARDITAYRTTLSGDLLGNDIDVNDPAMLETEPSRADNSLNVVTSGATGSTAVLDGCVICGGYGHGIEIAPDGRCYAIGCGGGMYSEFGSPTVMNCTFVGNTATWGGGMWSGAALRVTISCPQSDHEPTSTVDPSDASSVSPIEGVTSQSDSVWHGAFVMAGESRSPTVTNCTFLENAASRGGGLGVESGSPTLISCTFVRNSARRDGGAVYGVRSTVTLLGCAFKGNTAGNGGAIRSDGRKLGGKGSLAMILTNCGFHGNHASSLGGAVMNKFSHAVITNCIFVGNTADSGGAVANAHCNPQVKSCTFTGNWATDGGVSGGIWNGLETENYSASVPTLVNCIVWGNLFGQISGSATVSYSDVDGSWVGSGNMALDPRLTPDGHVVADSPCIDAGDEGYVPDPGTMDMDGEDRVFAGRLDIGSDEFVDSDRDRLPDWWEQRHFDDPHVAEPNADPDRDGLTNLQEYEVFSSNPISTPWHVDANNADDPLADGTAAHPFGAIQAGLNKATEGDTILVAQGTYVGPGNRDLDFHGKAVILRAPAGPHDTVIDCTRQCRGFHFHSGETAATAVIGFKIRNGRASQGGAIACRGSHPQIRNCVIEQNDEPNSGAGGLYCHLSMPTLADCTITDNSGCGIQVEQGGVRVVGNVRLVSDELVGNDMWLMGDGTLLTGADAFFDLGDSRIRCNVSGAGTIRVGPDAELVVEGDARINLGAADENGAIQCHGLLRARDHAQISNGLINVTRVSFEGEVGIFNSVITAEAGAPYGQFFVEDSVTISGNEIRADGDRYMDMDRSVFEGLVEDNEIYVTITEGTGGSRGGLLELRGQDGLAASSCGLDAFLCKVGPDATPDFDAASWTLEELRLVDGAKLNLTNRFDFQPPYDSGGEEEVLYVRDLVLGEGAILNTAFNRIYYENIHVADTAVVKNIPLLGFSLNIIALDDDIEFLTRISHNNSAHPENPDYDRIHVRRVTALEPDSEGMMQMCNRRERDPNSPQYGQVINARAKGLFAQAGEDRILVMFEYLFENSDSSSELVIYLSDVPELLNPSSRWYAEHYIEVARLLAPPPDRPGSVGSGRFGKFREYVSRRHLNFIKGTRIEFELVGPEGACVLINDWDPQVHCDGICMDLNWSDAPDEEDLLIVLAELGELAEMLRDATGSRTCLDGLFSADGFVDLLDIASWDWALNSDSRLNLCPDLPLTARGTKMAVTGSTTMVSAGSAALTNMPQDIGDLLITGKRSDSSDPGARKLHDRLYAFSAEGMCSTDFATDSGRCNIRLVRGPDGELYQINSEAGLTRLNLNGPDEPTVPPVALDYAAEPRYGKMAIVHIGIQGGGANSFGRPILDAAFDDNYVYVVPVVVAAAGETPYTAAAKLQLRGGSDPPYQIAQLYDDAPLPGDNQHRNNVREIEIDSKSNVYVLNVHSQNESDILFKYGPDRSIQRLGMGNPESGVYVPDPVGLHVSHAGDLVYLASAQRNPGSSDTTVLWAFSTDGLTLRYTIHIAGMQHLTSVTEDPSTGCVYAVGVNMIEPVPDFPDPAQPPFYYPCLARIPPESNSVEATALSDPACHDLALPMSVVWTGAVECFPQCHEDYNEWVSTGKPDCWCSPRQCHGDADGVSGGSTKTGVYYVGPSDLNLLVSSWLLKEPPHGVGIASVPIGVCADFAHDTGGSTKSGFYRVGPTDLNILITNWLKKEPPHGLGVESDCLDCP
jgi:hypothetical protein